MLFHVLSSLPEFYFLFKSKAKKDILKEIVGLNPFYSAFFYRWQQRLSSILIKKNKYHINL